MQWPLAGAHSSHIIKKKKKNPVISMIQAVGLSQADRQIKTETNGNTNQ